MSSFSCQVCNVAFEVPANVLAKYPGWQPRYCRDHSRKSASAASGQRPAQASKSGGGSKAAEVLTLAQVLARYRAGPTSGVFTDGSAVPNPGPGGWGVVWVLNNAIVEQRYGSAADTTNNRMELYALIEALRLLPEDAAEIVHTDSRLCVQTVEVWAASWERRGWQRKDGPIKNLELVQELFALRRARPRCKLKWVPAHSGLRWNEYADSLSTAWLRKAL